MIFTGDTAVCGLTVVICNAIELDIAVIMMFWCCRPCSAVLPPPYKEAQTQRWPQRTTLAEKFRGFIEDRLKTTKFINTIKTDVRGQSWNAEGEEEAVLRVFVFIKLIVIVIICVTFQTATTGLHQGTVGRLNSHRLECGPSSTLLSRWQWSVDFRIHY